MSMWETPAGPAGLAGGDDIALTTPVSAAAPSPGAARRRHLPNVRGCARAGQDRPLHDLR